MSGFPIVCGNYRLDYDRQQRYFRLRLGWANGNTAFGGVGRSTTVAESWYYTRGRVRFHGYDSPSDALRALTVVSGINSREDVRALLAAFDLVRESSRDAG